MVKVALGIVCSLARLATAEVLSPASLARVALPGGIPGGYLTLEVGRAGSLYNYTLIALELGHTVPHLSWMVMRVRGEAGQPGYPGMDAFSHEHPPDGERMALRAGVDLRHCSDDGCIFAGLDIGYFTERVEPCGGQECIVVEERDERGLVYGAGVGVHIGGRSAALRLRGEVFSTPDFRVGGAGTIGLVVYLDHATRTREARRRALAVASEALADSSCEQLMRAVVELQGLDEPVHDAFTRDDRVLECVQAGREREQAARARARAAADEQARLEDARRRQHTACLAQRKAMLQASETTSGDERERILARLPICE